MSISKNVRPLAKNPWFPLANKMFVWMTIRFIEIEGSGRNNDWVTAILSS